MNLRTWYLSARHRLFHGDHHLMKEVSGAEVFMRCTLCGLRSTGLEAGPLRLRSALPGIPERARLVVSAVARLDVPPAVLDVTVEAYLVPAPWEKDFPAGKDARVH